MAAHRYWRIQSHAVNTGQTGIGEIEMANTTGGTDLCTGGTAIASGSYGGGYSQSSAFDNNTTSNWFQNGGQYYEGAWVGYDFGSGNDVEVNEIRICPAVEDNNGCPRIFYVESSDDNSVWTFEFLGFNVSWASHTYVTFQRPAVQASNQHWGVFCIRHNIGTTNRDVLITEMELRTSIGGADQTGSGSARAYPASGDAGNVFDNNGTSYWYSSDAGKGAMVVYDLGSAMTIVEFAIRSGTDGGYNNQNRAPKDGYLMYSQDGFGWGRCGSFTGETYGNYETKTFLVEGIAPPPAAPRRKLIVAN